MRIFWSNVQNYSTLIACLPNESKEIFSKNGIIISTPYLRFPIFNYATFCKVLSINRVHYEIKGLLKKPQQNLNNNTHIVVQEICKMLMSQISSLKSLTFLQYNYLTFTFYPGSKDCLKNLSELHCNSEISSEFFYHLSQIYNHLI